jgi:cobalt-zinc-cadmium efflux system outer membrane protein
MSPFSLLKPWLPAMLLAAGAAWAQEQPAIAPLTLQQAFAAAWARQPEARAQAARRDAAQARLETAGSWFAAPPAAEITARSDQLNRNQGSREYEVGVALPLWLPGERSRSLALADAELGAVDSRLQGRRWRLAATVRAAYWNWQLALIERHAAQARQANAELLAADVARRVRAGDLSRADRHQAEGAAASAAVAVAEAEAALALASQELRSLVGQPLPAAGADLPEPLPDAGPAASDGHPALRELIDRAEVARRGSELARTQGRANPELLVAATRERGAAETAFSQTMTLGVRIPFGSDGRRRAQLATAAAEESEAAARLAVEQERIEAEIETARTQVRMAQAQVAAAERRASLARETRGFFDKSFRLGESDLPTRLRIELEAFEAERQAARARVEAARAISSLRQALGLLPE